MERYVAFIRLRILIRPTFKFLRVVLPLASSFTNVFPVISWTWTELKKPFELLPEIMETLLSLYKDPWKPLNVFFVTSDGKRYQVAEDHRVGLPRFGRASKAD